MKTFSPAGRITPEEDTIGRRLQRLARAALPVYVPPEEAGPRKRKRRLCACGAPLHNNPKIRQKRMVCDDCAELMPSIKGGPKVTNTCAGCGGGFPRRQLKMRNYKHYCAKCLKTKF